MPSSNIIRHLKTTLRQWRRWLADLRSGTSGRFATCRKQAMRGGYSIEQHQRIPETPWSENKRHNLRLAAARLSGIRMDPGRILSFFHAVGRPTRRRGYLVGRNLIGGKLSEDVGGGLCQLSGILYHTALIGGLDIVERHAHSLDIYQDKDRFSPLGSDATIVFGYKDLRLRNPHPFPVWFEFEVGRDRLSCALRSEQPITPADIVFERFPTDQGIIVITRSGTTAICESIYRH